jgi:hypothetical protein
MERQTQKTPSPGPLTKETECGNEFCHQYDWDSGDGAFIRASWTAMMGRADQHFATVTVRGALHHASRLINSEYQDGVTVGSYRMVKEIN